MRAVKAPIVDGIGEATVNSWLLRAASYRLQGAKPVECPQCVLALVPASAASRAKFTCSARQQRAAWLKLAQAVMHAALSAKVFIHMAMGLQTVMKVEQ